MTATRSEIFFLAHDPSDDASLLRPALEFMIAAGTKGEPDEDVDDGEVYQDDYADILVEEAEGRYKDILDYRDYEYVDDRWNNDWDDDAPSDEAMATH